MKERPIKSVLKEMKIFSTEKYSIFQEVSLRGTITRAKSDKDLHDRKFSVKRVKNTNTSEGEPEFYLLVTRTK